MNTIAFASAFNSHLNRVVGISNIGLLNRVVGISNIGLLNRDVGISNIGTST